VAIARALVNEPALILADEPTGNLDSETSIDVMSVFQELNDQGITILLVTHEHDIAEYAKRVVELRDGLIKLDVLVKDRRIEEKRTMKWGNLIKVAFKSLIRNKMRSFLTMLGIIIGVGAVIALVSVGNGAQVQIQQQIASLGTNLLMVMPSSGRIAGVSQGAGTRTSITLDDVDALTRKASLLQGVSPTIRGSGTGCRRNAKLVHLL
jgi:macrolide transport system ATP-binding/permease protein